MPLDDNRVARAELAPFALAQTGTFDLTARDGSPYRILVAWPDAPPPAAGYPTIVLVDGQALFATAVTAARLQAIRTDVTGIEPAVIVGIGYPGEAPFDAERRQRDLLPVEGGADRFLATIVDEILPAVAEHIAALDPNRRTLVGHSYGGLFALHTLFTRPGLFGAHVAGSPSIWWNERAILLAEERFRSGTGFAGRLMIAVGGAEQDETGNDDPRRRERRAMARMRDNAAEMAARLSASGRVESSFVEWPGENHVSVIPAMLSRAVGFALAAPGSSGRRAA
ncbi:alpha/beta hydrolase [Bosea sp. RAF48]|uniref:alpha/beta hydrolase n=1 Tax=Bosea sp. RAF48 TaxID=3237480 RepID=UPI003F91E096